jgi:hypothetical protein
MALSRSGVRAPYPPLLLAAFLPSKWRISRLLFCILALVSAAGAGGPDKAAQESDLQRFADVRVDENEALGLIKRIRQNAPKKDEATIWARVANSDKYSDIRRRRAIFQLFDRHVRQGMTLGELANLLAKPSWLKRKSIYRGMEPGFNYSPIYSAHGESIFRLCIHLPYENTSGVYMRVEDFLAGNPLTEDSFYGTLQGKEAKATQLKITAMVILPDTAEDIACVTHRNDPCPRSYWPHHWEIKFSTDDKDLFARQLDFFGIELAVLMPGRLVYAFHLSKAEPDTRVVSNIADNENRYWLWRKSDSTKAERELLKGAGIESGDRLILKFLSRPVERKLIDLEESYQGAHPRDIKRTCFGVRATGNEFSFYVLEQTLKESKTLGRKSGQRKTGPTAPGK